jgi:2-desacetyl-2-hydroxyethyl bacteriochlorophyllide A dehydrogenase
VSSEAPGRAAVLTAPRELELRAAGGVEPRPGDAIVRVAASGICGTDVEIYEGHIPVESGRVLGHEGAGVLEWVPDGVGLEPGMQVVVDPVLACGHCSSCREDLPNLCLQGGLLGRDSDGLFADRICVPATNCTHLPEHLPLEDAPAIQVLATVVHAQSLIRVVPSRVSAVVGLGFTGQLHAQLLRVRGARVLGITRTAEKRAVAAELACEWTAAPDAAPGVARDATREGLVDLVVEASGTIAGLAQALELVRPGGTILWYGTCTATQGALPFYSVYAKEVRLIGARASKPRDIEIAADLVASGAVAVAPLVTNRLPLSDITTAIELSRGGALKVMLVH